MKQFIVLYYATQEAMEQMKDQMKNSSPEQMAEEMKPWMAWKDRCGDGLVDIGTPLGNGQKMMSDGSAPSEKNIIGYSILQADDMDGAKAMLKDHPHLTWAKGCSIEVYESMPFPSA